MIIYDGAVMQRMEMESDEVKMGRKLLKGRRLNVKVLHQTLPIKERFPELA